MAPVWQLLTLACSTMALLGCVARETGGSDEAAETGGSTTDTTGATEDPRTADVFAARDLLPAQLPFGVHPACANLQAEELGWVVDP